MFKKVNITPRANYHPVGTISNFSNMSIVICYIQQKTVCQFTELGCVNTSVLNMLPNPLTPNPKLPKNCLSVFDHFVGLALNGLTHVLVMLPVSSMLSRILLH